MGLFDRFTKRKPDQAGTQSGRPTMPLGGIVDVVGESAYQDAFVRITGGKRPEGFDEPVMATLVPEAGAIEVYIGEDRVGSFSSRDAGAYGRYVLAIIARHGVATAGAIIRGGWDNGAGDTGMYGLQLWIDPSSTHVRAHTGTIHIIDMAHDDGSYETLCGYEVKRGTGTPLHGDQINPTRATLLQPVTGNICKRCENA
jgi:hypothetical protein